MLDYVWWAIVIVLSSFLWRVRGGLRFYGRKVPANKIWYALFFCVIGCFSFESIEKSVIGFVACYVSYQLYGWGLYIGRLLEGGELRPNLVQYQEWSTMVQEALHEVMANGAEPQDVMEELQQKVTSQITE